MGTVTDLCSFELSSANSTRTEGRVGEKSLVTRIYLVVSSRARWTRNRILRDEVSVYSKTTFFDEQKGTCPLASDYQRVTERHWSA